MYLKDFTPFEGNAIAIDPSDCGCTDCIVGDSIPWVFVDEAELARQILRGRRVLNRTHEELEIRINDNMRLVIERM